MSKNENTRKPKQAPAEEVETVETPVEQPAEEEVVKKTTKEAVVSGCNMLNIRADSEKDAPVVAVVSVGTEVIVDKCKTKGWYKVWLANGVSGFCMKDYITINKP